MDGLHLTLMSTKKESFSLPDLGSGILHNLRKYKQARHPLGGQFVKFLEDRSIRLTVIEDGYRQTKARIVKLINLDRS